MICAAPQQSKQTVIVENGGTHHYALDNHRGKDKAAVADLCETLLNRLNLQSDYTWTLRVEKTLHCSSETRPCRIVSHSLFGVSLKLKAKPYDTVDHLFTLLLPNNSGMSPKFIYEKLKLIEKSVSRNWRDEERQKRMSKTVETIAKVEEMPIPPDDQPRPDFSNLQGIIADSVKLTYVLRKIYKLSLSNAWKSDNDWRTNLMIECGWTDKLHRHVSITLRYLAIRGYLTDFFTDKCVKSGYKLTPLGMRLLSGDLSAMDEGEQIATGKKQASKERKSADPVIKIEKIPVSNIADLIASFTEKAQQLADTGKRINDIRFQRKQLEDQISVLQKQIEDLRVEEKSLIATTVNNPELISFLSQSYQGR